MSDEKDKEKDKKKDKKEVEDKSTPDVIDPAVTEWFERLFRGEERARFVYAYRLGGRNFTEEKDELKKYPFPGEEKPKKEDIVRISNEFVLACQDEADQLGKALKFRLKAYNNQKGGLFDTKLVSVYPKVDKLVPVDREVPDDGSVDDATGADYLRARVGDALRDVLAHTGINHQATIGIINALLDQLKDANEEIRSMRAELRAVYALLNSQKNADLDREVVRMKEQFALDAKRKGMDLLAVVLPDWWRRVTSDKDAVAAGGEQDQIPAAEAMRRAMGLLSKDEQVAIFGRWDGDQLRERGILTEMQVRIVAAVLNDGAPDSTLDRLFQGPDQITDQQYLATAQAVGINKVVQLRVLFQQRKLGSAPPPPAPKLEN